MKTAIQTDRERKDYGDLSAVEPWHRIMMHCHDCRVVWYGCWDNFECPECGNGELPWITTDLLSLQKHEIRKSA